MPLNSIWLATGRLVIVETFTKLAGPRAAIGRPPVITIASPLTTKPRLSKVCSTIARVVSESDTWVNIKGFTPHKIDS